MLDTPNIADDSAHPSMRDIDIRRELSRTVIATHERDPDTLVVEELSICQGESRIDLAVVNGEFNGWEIKSDHDSLQRLPRQVELYCAVFDRVTLVTGERFALATRERVPEWWGLLLATGLPEKPFRELRRAKKNSAVEPLKLVQLLWRDEVVRALARVGRINGLTSAPKRKLWQALATAMPIRELKAEVRSCLKSRKDWRAAAA
jgi:hypothetical protein